MGSKQSSEENIQSHVQQAVIPTEKLIIGATLPTKTNIVVTPGTPQFEGMAATRSLSADSVIR